MKWSELLSLILMFLGVIVFYSEFLMYYVVLAQCQWPTLHSNKSNTLASVKSVILADTHLLGPLKGHWFDKLIREWHMYRAFQASMAIFRPDVVFILGDVFDEGHLVNDAHFKKYVQRFRKLFYVPKGTQVICLVGNHDVGFHYRMDPYFLNRFEKEFNYTGVHLYTIKDVHFVFVNSMAMEDDRCELCARAYDELKQIGEKLKCMKDSEYHNCSRPQLMYSRPILMQHFPTYRISDALCVGNDLPTIQSYKENWDVLSKSSTNVIGKIVNPRLAFSGHSHHYCKSRNQLDIEEYTVASYSWRNKFNPSFLLAQFTQYAYGVTKCDMPVQSTYIAIYISSLVVCMMAVVLHLFIKKIKKYSKKRID